MKIKLLTFAILIISVIGYFSFVNSGSIKIQLIEAKTNSPFKNHDIEIYYYQMVYDASPILELIKKDKTDSTGNFELPRRIFGDKVIGVKCGEDYEMATIEIKENKIWLFRTRNGLGDVFSKTCYDLSTMTETNFNYYKDTIDAKFESIQLVAYDKIGYWTKLEEKIKENQKEFETDQEMLWNYLWSAFEKSVNGETTPPFNTNEWFKHVITCKRLFDLDLMTAYKEAKKINDSNKLYYHLYSLCLIINGNGGVKNESEKDVVEWIDKEVKRFYEENQYLDLNVKNGRLPMDILSTAYQTMKKMIEK